MIEHHSMCDHTECAIFGCSTTMRFAARQAPKGHRSCLARRTGSWGSITATAEYECECGVVVKLRSLLDVHFAAVRS